MRRSAGGRRFPVKCGNGLLCDLRTRSTEQSLSCSRSCRRAATLHHVRRQANRERPQRPAYRRTIRAAIRRGHGQVPQGGDKAVVTASASAACLLPFQLRDRRRIRSYFAFDGCRFDCKGSRLVVATYQFGRFRERSESQAPVYHLGPAKARDNGAAHDPIFVLLG
jgi:hypothetical protein